jgi:RNA polymerase sigma-70 factor (ECF subfamily)
MERSLFEDDSVLIRSCIEQDHSAWDFFVKKYSGHMITSMTFRLRKYGIYLKAEELEEIQQDTLALLWKGGKLAEIRNPASIKYWLAIVSGNAAVQHMRHKKRAKRLIPLSLSEKICDGEITEVMPSRDLSPADELDRAEMSKRIEEAMESLTDRQRLALKLNLIHGKKYAEIAAIMAIPVPTAASHIRRAKERLQKKLQQFRCP